MCPEPPAPSNGLSYSSEGKGDHPVMFKISENHLKNASKRQGAKVSSPKYSRWLAG
jgi:hypothetical protein